MVDLWANGMVLGDQMIFLVLMHAKMEIRPHLSSVLLEVLPLLSYLCHGNKLQSNLSDGLSCTKSTE